MLVSSLLFCSSSLFIPPLFHPCSPRSPCSSSYSLRLFITLLFVTLVSTPLLTINGWSRSSVLLFVIVMAFLSAVSRRFKERYRSKKARNKWTKPDPPIFSLSSVKVEGASTTTAKPSDDSSKSSIKAPSTKSSDQIRRILSSADDDDDDDVGGPSSSFEPPRNRFYRGLVQQRQPLPAPVARIDAAGSGTLRHEMVRGAVRQLMDPEQALTVPQAAHHHPPREMTLRRAPRLSAIDRIYNEQHAHRTNGQSQGPVLKRTPAVQYTRVSSADDDAAPESSRPLQLNKGQSESLVSRTTHKNEPVLLERARRGLRTSALVATVVDVNQDTAERVRARGTSRKFPLHGKKRSASWAGHDPIPKEVHPHSVEVPDLPNSQAGDLTAFVPSGPNSASIHPSTIESVASEESPEFRVTPTSPTLPSQTIRWLTLTPDPPVPSRAH